MTGQERVMNKRLTCPECGNRERFVHRNVEYVQYHYDRDGVRTYLLALECVESVPVICGECGLVLSDKED